MKCTVIINQGVRDNVYKEGSQQEKGGRAPTSLT